MSILTAKPWLLSKDVLDLTKSGLSKKYRLVLFHQIMCIHNLLLQVPPLKVMARLGTFEKITTVILYY